MSRKKQALLKSRNTLIDSARGFAILIMIAANSWPYLVPINYCPLGLRLLFSIAAPIFIFLSGVSLCLAEEAGKPIKSQVKRIIQILLVAFIIDAFVWRIFPFYTFDVLYLIAFSLSLVLIIRKLALHYQLIITSTIFLASIILLEHYQFELSSLSLFGIKQFSLTTAIKQALLSGWFPMLPWSGVCMLGYLLAKHRQALVRYKVYWYLAGLIFIGLSVVLYMQPGAIPADFRIGYTELFYPVKGNFYVLLLGLCCVLIPIIGTPYNKVSLLSAIGNKSLFIYFVHIIIIKYVFFPLVQDAESFQWWISAIHLLAFYLSIIAINYMVQTKVPDLKHGKYKRIGFITGF
ncbi:heparan-alpha-glucosaminide N-acetyltransferase domain-containing protein [Carboxylicivirga sp. M1479]|uniref:heparan-alpha-glucosaminide N-acetyltransferase domain-containing protein n=1 Tax=Carboxylicivirga sp. M1479 TaxID=2594476 RepID=UPI00163D7BD2|nr:heparan-alpha-glucosaminide N-acetyltransferase domain-containing protein [Carboxylicivirga sp. M1479]